MDADKARFLFGEAGADADSADDPDEELHPARAALRRVIAEQIERDEPPEVWATAQRLLEHGVEREEALSQLAMAFTQTILHNLDDAGPSGPDIYVTELRGLPLPTMVELEAALLGIVRARPGITVDDADRAALDQLGRPPDDKLTRALLSRVGEHLADDYGPIAWLAGDRCVHVEDLTAGVVLTHRLSDVECQTATIVAGFDLAGFVWRGDLRMPGGEEIVVDDEDDDQVIWSGPDGWLERYSDGDLLAVRVDGDGVVSVEGISDEPATGGPLVDRIRGVYDLEVEEPGLPVSGDDLVLGLLLEDRDTFAEPRPPLDELCTAGGLARRGRVVAHDDEIWANEARERRSGRLLSMFDDPDDAAAAAAALDAADDGDVGPDDLREILSDLRDAGVLSEMTDELLGYHDEASLVTRARRFSDRLLEAAQRAEEIAVARWLAAVVAEREGDVLAAEAHLAAALEADRGWLPAVDRAAWYASDRGDAAGATRLWRQLDLGPEDNADLAMVERFSRPGGPKLGRNDPCWCGSGRKFKACHLGVPTTPPLAERVGWLYRKANAYLQRRGGRSSIEVVALAESRAIDPDDPDSVAEALEDPIVVDIALTEAGWFERFVADRGPLLPTDEAQLASDWIGASRTLYEVVETRPGRGVTLRERGPGDRLAEGGPALSRQTKPGQVVCARAVPVGETHQVIGGVFRVILGTESEVQELCDQRRGHELCAYVARQLRPRAVQTREGEPGALAE